MPPNPIDEVALAERLTRLEEGQKALVDRVDNGFQGLRGDLARYIEAQKENDERTRVLEKEQAQHCTALAAHATAMSEQKIDTDKRLNKLSGRINTWGGGNSLAIAVGYLASIFDFLRSP